MGRVLFIFDLAVYGIFKTKHFDSSQAKKSQKNIIKKPGQISKKENDVVETAGRNLFDVVCKTVKLFSYNLNFAFS
jgi:hypothetical protein